MAAHNARLVEQARLARHTRIVQSATTKRDLAGPDPDREPADEYKRKGG
jgi:cell division protein FtsL